MNPRVLGGLILLISLQAHADSLTSSNIRGQKYLFEHGWYVITSPKEAWSYAQENSVQSREAFLKALVKARDEAQTQTLKENLAVAVDSMKATYGLGNEASKKLSNMGTKVAQKNLQTSRKQLGIAWEKFTLGYVEYKKTNQEDVEALKKVNLEFFKRHQEEIATMNEAVEVVFGKFIDRNKIEWKKYFKEGKYHFEEQYEKSGTRSNSIQGLWDVVAGYGKFLYHSVFRPGGKVVKKSIVNSGHYATEVVLHTFIGAYNIIYSSGVNLYYAFKLGYKVISPTVEAGWYSSLALVNAASAPVLWGGLEAAGTVTKVATTASAPLVGATQFTIAESVDAAKKAAVYLYHGGTGTVRVGLETLESGVVLGYSALSQIPPQLLLTSMNAAIFLVYDGPRMILVKAQGKIGNQEVSEVPVGTVMDMKKLQEEGVEIVPITNDEFILKKVLQYAD